MAHIPVLANEIVRLMDVKANRNYVDGTVGEGGHAELLLFHNGPRGMLLAIDQDRAMIARAQQHLARFGPRVLFAHDTYAHIASIVEKNNFSSIYGILLDLGVSSYHFEESGGGFSFKHNEPLDMRFDRARQGITAADIVNEWDEENLAELFFSFGGARDAKRIAAAIVRKRRVHRLATTHDLIRIIESVTRRHGRIHPATKIFQALRIAINNELAQLTSALPAFEDALMPGGRLAVISYHSLEDRIVKSFMRQASALGRMSLITKKPVTPAFSERRENPRSRSAKLRVAQKI